jgi:hypothetical protein
MEQEVATTKTRNLQSTIRSVHLQLYVTPAEHAALQEATALSLRSIPNEIRFRLMRSLAEDRKK